MDNLNMKIIGHIRTEYDSKFGIPRQSGLASSSTGIIEFEREFQIKEMFNGIEEYSHLWVLWVFSENIDKGWTPTVRPPALGGNRRKGLFATRTPFRPNPVALSSVELLKVEFTEDRGPLLYIKGPDMLDGTPILDIKPYVNLDCHPEARCSFSQKGKGEKLKVTSENRVLDEIPEELKDGLIQALSLDPRPAYQRDNQRTYGMSYGGYEVKFKVNEEDLVITSIEKK